MGGGESSLGINRKFFFIFRSFLIFVSSLVWLSWFYVHKNPRQYFVISRFYLEIHHNPKTLSPSFRRHFLSPRSPALRDSRGCACRRVHQQTTLYKCIYNPLVLKTCKDLTFCSSSSVKPSEHSSAFIHCWEPSLSRPARDFARPTRATTEYVHRSEWWDRTLRTRLECCSFLPLLSLFISKSFIECQICDFLRKIWSILGNVNQQQQSFPRLGRTRYKNKSG